MKKFENFCKALNNLKEIKEVREPYDVITLTGLVGLYEIAFEQAWKSMKEILEDHGYAEAQTGSPKKVLQTAYGANMISNEEKWLSALASRNNVAHAYDESVAMDIVHKTKEIYLELFETLKAEIQDNWI